MEKLGNFWVVFSTICSITVSRILEGHMVQGHVRMLILIPPKYLSADLARI